MFRIQPINNAKRVITVNPENFSEGIDHIITNACDGININLLHNENGDLCDFSLLEKVSMLTYLSLTDSIIYNNQDNFQKLRHLKELDFIGVHLNSKSKVIFDISNFTKLKGLMLTDSKSIINWEKVANLNFLQIWKFHLNTIEYLKSLVNLQELKIIQSKIENLSGLSLLKKVVKLDISYCSDLIDISPLNNSSVKHLTITNCKNISDLKQLSYNSTIEFLYIDKLVDLSDIISFKNIKYIGFNDLKNGDISPLLNCSSLEKVGFYPNKKHYSHKQEEINRILEEKKS
jgi:internalin A